MNYHLKLFWTMVGTAFVGICLAFVAQWIFLNDPYGPESWKIAVAVNTAAMIIGLGGTGLCILFWDYWDNRKSPKPETK